MRWLSPRLLRRTRARYGLSVFAFLAVASQLGSVAHLALVRHVECADHGEMVEVSASAAPSSDHEDLTAAFHEEAAPTHGHDHCSVVTLRRERTQISASPAVAEPQPRTDLGRTLVRAIAPPPSIAILSFAPKNSPPTV